jgi:hypothetical protein
MSSLGGWWTTPGGGDSINQTDDSSVCLNDLPVTLWVILRAALAFGIQQIDMPPLAFALTKVQSQGRGAASLVMRLQPSRRELPQSL